MGASGSSASDAGTSGAGGVVSASRDNGGLFRLSADDFSKIISALAKAYGSPAGQQSSAFRTALLEAHFDEAKVNLIVAMSMAAMAAQRAVKFAAQATSARRGAREPATVGAGEDCYCGGGYFDSEVRGGGLGDLATKDPVQSLVSYSQSESAAAKEGLIRAAARALKDMGLSKIDPEGDLAEVVKQIREEIPNPARGQNFKAEAASQIKVCEALAKLFNERFTPGAAGKARLINGESPGDICQQVSAIAGSFMASTSIEFLETYESSQRALETLKLITESLTAVEHALDEKVVASADEGLLRKTAADRDVAASLRAELRRAVVMMENILQVELPPVKAILAKYIREKEGENHRIASVVAKLGTSDFSDGISAALLGLGSATAVAELVNNALAALGMKTREFLESPSLEALRKKVRESAHGDSELLMKYTMILDKLKKVFAVRNNPDVRAAIEGAGSASRVVGGAPPKSSIAKQIERVKDEKLVLMRAFAAELEGSYNALIRAVKALVPMIGTEIPITEATDRLKEAFTRLADSASGDKPIEAALVGAYNDADARERKGRFLASLGLISAACSGLADKSIYGSAKDLILVLRGAIDEISRVVDSYSGAMERKFGGAEGDSGLAGVVTSMHSLTRLLNEAIGEFTYKYFAAKVQENLSQTHSEIGLYSEKYEALLGDAIAARLYKVAQEREAAIRALDIGPNLAVSGNGCALLGGDPLRPINWLPGADTDSEQRKKARDAVLSEVKGAYDAKTRFYRVLQAIDLYLKAFAEGIASDPSAVRKIKTMLDDTPVIARWFGEVTGDKLYAGFEQFPAVSAASRPVENTLGAAILADTREEHYYEKIGTQHRITAHCRLGVPSIGIRPDGRPEGTASLAKKNINEAIDNFQALKNLVSAFTRIGDEFGGKSLRESVFMPPSQIYRDLVSYLKASALEVHMGNTGSIGVTAGGSLASVAMAFCTYELHAPQATQTTRFFAEEDEHFVRILKTMSAKILVTLGVYDLLERTVPKFDLTPTRMILGGGVGGLDTPEEDAVPIPEAAELYFRLPRLAEFYRGFLSWEGDQKGAEQIDGDFYKVAMLPEVEGIFSGLISLVFVRAIDPTSGVYSEVEMKALIAAINKIYLHFSGRDPERPIKSALTAFVVEVNRRFGLVKSKDIKEYWELVRLSRRGQGASASSITDYNILPDESAETAVRRAPSDRFSSIPFQQIDPGTGRPIDPTTGRPIDPYAGRVGLSPGARNLLAGFWKKLGAALKQGRTQANGPYSYSGHIQQAQTQLGRTSGAERLKVVFDLIQEGSLEHTTNDRLLLFGETVVAGLNTLSALEAVLSQLSSQFTAMNPVRLEAAIIDSIELGTAGSALKDKTSTPVGGPRRLPSNKTELAEHIALYLPEMVAGTGSQLDETIVGGRYLVENDECFDSRAIPSPIHRIATRVYTCTGALGAHNPGAAPHSTSRLWSSADPSLRPSRFFFSPEGEDDPSPPQFDRKSLEQTIVERTADAAAAGAAGARIGKLRLAARLLVDYPQIMTDFLELTSAISAEGGVSVRYTRRSGRPPLLQLDFSTLKQQAEALLRDIKANFELLRPYLPKAVVDKYEKLENLGSIYWLEANLFDARLRGSMDSTRTDRDLTVEGIGRKANLVMQGLLRKTNAPFRDSAGRDLNLTLYDNAASMPGIAYDRALTWGQVPAPVESEAFGTAISRLLHWDALTKNTHNSYGQDMGLGSAVPHQGNTAFPTLAGLVMAVSPAAAGGAQPNLVKPDAGFSRVPIWGGSAGHLGPALSIVFALNQLIAGLLETSIDPSTKKIYQPILDSLTNGVLSEAVASPEMLGFPDLRAEGLTGTGIWGDPKPTGILGQSLGWVLQRLTRDTVGVAMTPKHLVQTLTEVPLYMKERLRASLPVHIALLEALQNKCEFVRDFIQNTEMHCSLARLASCALPDGANIGPDVVMYLPITDAELVAAAVRPATPLGYVFNRVDASVTTGNRRMLRAGGVAVPWNYLTVKSNPAAPSPNEVENMKYALAGGGVRSLFPILDNADFLPRVNDILNSVLSVCYAATGAASGVLRELADNPVFLQSQEGAIEQFTMRTGRKPLMPPSLALAALGDVAASAAPPTSPPNRTRYLVSSKTLSTGHSLNGADHRLLYGVRGVVLGKKPVDQALFPWLHQFLAEEIPSSFASKFPEDLAFSTVTNTVGILRWLVGIRHIASQITSGELPIGYRVEDPLGAVLACTLFSPRGDSGLSNNASAAPRVFSIQGGVPYLPAGANRNRGVLFPSRSAVDVLSVVENTNEAGAKQKLVANFAALAGGIAQNSREAQCIANLVDMNIMPVNVHALMRDIPLANLYNYSEAFTRIVAFSLGVPEDDLEAPQVDGRGFLLKFLHDPFRAVSLQEYGFVAPASRLGGPDTIPTFPPGHSPVSRMLCGTDGTGMGRPRFLSDQLHNKVLLGSVYSSRSPPDEAGPSLHRDMVRSKDLQIRIASMAAQLANSRLGVELNASGNTVVKLCEGISTVVRNPSTNFTMLKWAYSLSYRDLIPYIEMLVEFNAITPIRLFDAGGGLTANILREDMHEFANLDQDRITWSVNSLTSDEQRRDIEAREAQDRASAAAKAARRSSKEAAIRALIDDAVAEATMRASAVKDAEHAAALAAKDASITAELARLSAAVQATLQQDRVAMERDFAARKLATDAELEKQRRQLLEDMEDLTNRERGQAESQRSVEYYAAQLLRTLQDAQATADQAYDDAAFAQSQLETEISRARGDPSQTEFNPALLRATARRSFAAKTQLELADVYREEAVAQLRQFVDATSSQRPVGDDDAADASLAGAGAGSRAAGHPRRATTAFAMWDSSPLQPSSGRVRLSSPLRAARSTYTAIGDMNHWKYIGETMYLSTLVEGWEGADPDGAAHRRTIRGSIEEISGESDDLLKAVFDEHNAKLGTADAVLALNNLDAHCIALAAAGASPGIIRRSLVNSWTSILSMGDMTITGIMQQALPETKEELMLQYGEIHGEFHAALERANVKINFLGDELPSLTSNLQREKLDENLFARSPVDLLKKAINLQLVVNKLFPVWSVLSIEQTVICAKMIAYMRWHAASVRALELMQIPRTTAWGGGNPSTKLGGADTHHPLLSKAGVPIDRQRANQAFENAMCRLAKYLAMGAHDNGGNASIISQVLTAGSIDLPGFISEKDQKEAVLTYMKDSEKVENVVKRVDITTGSGPLELTLVGYSRFNTTIIRKLIFITQLQRVVRKQLSRVLTHERDVLRSSHAGVAPEVTEYGFDPYSANEVSTSRPRGLNYGVRPDATGTWVEGEGRWLDGK